jgi:AcrR family transcriptional regulator
MSHKSTLTAVQRRCAEILATNDIHQLTIEQIAEELNVSPRTIYRWKNDPVFIAYQNEIAERVMDDFLAETYGMLRKIVRTGNVKAIELVLKNRGRLTEVQKIEANIEDNRSNEAKRQEIEELKRLLGRD